MSKLMALRNIITAMLAILACLRLSCNLAFAENKKFQWSTRFAASEQYDDNINLDPVNEEYDWITSFGPGLTLSVLTEKTNMSLNYDLYLVAYARNNENNTVRHYLTLDGLKGIPIAENVTLDIIESLQVSEDPIELSQYVTSVRRSRDRYLRNTAGARVNYFFGERDSLYAGFHHILLLNEDPTVEDSQKFQPTVGINYWFNIRNGLNFDYSYVKGDFDVSENFDEHLATATYTHRFNVRTQADLSYRFDSFNYEGTTEDYVVHSAMLGLSHLFTEDVSATVGGGYWVQKRQRTGETSRPLGEISLDGKFRFEKGALSLNTSTGYRQQFFEAEDLGFTIYSSGSASLTYRLLENLTGELSALYQRDDYLETDPDREDETWGGAVRLVYYPVRWLSATLQYEYRQRDSNVSINDYANNRVTLILGAYYFSETKPF